MASRHLGKIQGLKDYLRHALPQNECEKSAVFTLGVLPDNADNIDSLKSVLDHLHELYGVGTYQVHHVVVGDQKLFQNMRQLKQQYGADLEWLLPYPGGWHVLKNYQPILKLYFHAGLRELTLEAGYKGTNLSALESSSNFKHTNIFLFEAYESVYLHALELYLATKHAQVATHDGFSH